MTTSPEPLRHRRGNRLGISAFVCSIVLIGWVIALVYLAIGGLSNDSAGFIATIMFFASWVVIPLLVLAVLLLAIFALVLNPVAGKILGALAIVAPIVVAVLFIVASGGFDLLSSFV